LKIASFSSSLTSSSWIRSKTRPIISFDRFTASQKPAAAPREKSDAVRLINRVAVFQVVQFLAHRSPPAEAGAGDGSSSASMVR